MTPNIDEINSDLSALKKDITAIKDLLTTSLPKIDHNFINIQGQIAQLNQKLEALQLTVMALDKNTDKGLQDVGVKLENLTDEIGKIGQVTNYSDQYNNLKSFN